MKMLAFLITIHLLAFSFARAQEPAGPTENPAGFAEGETRAVLSGQNEMELEKSTGKIDERQFSSEPRDAFFDSTNSFRNQPALDSHEEAAKQSAPDGKVDDCKDILPRMESDYREVERRSRDLDSESRASQETYLLSFNQMTETLFQMSESREMETQKISLGRDAFRDSLKAFDQNKSRENSRALQDHYLNLTMLLYSSMADSQKSLEKLKAQISHIEKARNQYISFQREMESLDRKKLDIEAKLISLKIKCQPFKRY